MSEFSLDTEFLGKTLKSIGDGVIAADIQGKIIFLNKAAEKLTGWSQETAVGRFIEEAFKIVDEETGMALENPFEQVIEKGDTIGLKTNTVLITKNGKELRISANASPILSNSNNIMGVVIVFRNITKLKRTEQKLANEQKNMLTIFNAAPVGMVILDENCVIKQVNNAALSIYRINHSHVINKRIGNAFNCLHSFESQFGCGYSSFCEDCKFDKTLEDVIKLGEEAYDLEIEQELLIGGELVNSWIKLSATPILIDGKKHLVVVIENITEHKKAEDSIKRYKVLSEKVKDIIVFNDMEGNILEANNAAVEAYGYSYEELTNLRIYDIRKDAIKPEVIKHAVQKGISYEAIHKRKDGSTFPVEINATGTEINNKKVMVAIIRDVTERKNSEEELQRYRLLAENANDMIFLIDPESRIIDVNNVSMKAYGYTREELLNLHAYDIDKSLTMSIVEEINDGVHNKGKGYLIETIHTRKDGTTFPVEVSLQGAEVGGKKIIMSITRDITERAQAQIALTESERHLRNITDNMIDLIAQIDLEGKIKYVSPSHLRVQGYSPEFMVGKNIREFSHPDDIEKGFVNFKEMLENKKPQQLVLRVKHADGHCVWIESIGNPLFDEENNMVGVIMSSRDITERVKAEEELKKSREKYQSLFKNMINGFAYHKVILDDNGKPVDYVYTEVNDEFAQLMGQKRQDLVGKRLSEILPNHKELPFDRVGVFGKVAMTGESIRVEDYYSEIAERWYTCSVFSTEKGYFAMLLSDISERKKVEEETKRAMEAAEAANKAKSEFLANMSHEIRTPINGIIGMIDLTLLTDLTSKQNENLTIAKNCANSLLTVINDILDFSKIEAGKMRLESISFNIRDFIEEIVSTHSHAASKKGLKLLYDVQQAVPEIVVSDPNRLQQVLNNLIGNAIKFTDKGYITLKVEKSEQGGKIKFSVADTGIGIACYEMDRLFKSFSQVDSTITRKYGGTGLGLVITKRLAEMLGGTLEVISEKGVGSTFFFTIKSEQPQKANKAATSEQKEIKSFDKKLNILVVEDDKVNQMVIKDMLKEKDHSIIIVNNGQEALNALEQENYDLIFMDIQMPVMDGVEATKRIRDREKASGGHIPIVALTAHALQGDKDRFIAAGMDEYLSKPFDMQSLYRVIDAAIQNISGINENDVINLSEEYKKNGSELIINKEEFKNNSLELVEEIILALGNMGVMRAEELTHSIKLTAGDLSLETVKSLAFKMELCLRRGDLGEAYELCKKLKEALCKV